MRREVNPRKYLNQTGDRFPVYSHDGFFALRSSKSLVRSSLKAKLKGLVNALECRKNKGNFTV